MSGSAQWDQAENLLCIRLDAMGDLLMTTPALRALKESRRGRKLTLLASPAGAAVAGLIPELDDILLYESPWMKSTPPRDSIRPDVLLIDRLRRRRFDGAVIFTVYSQSALPAALLCYLAEIPLRLAHCRENPYQLLTHRVIDPEPERLLRHEVRRQLDLVAAIGCRAADERLSIRLPGEAMRFAMRLLRRQGIVQEQPWVLIHPGASAESRRYPAERFAEVGRRLATELGWTVVFSGSEGEVDLVDAIRTQMNAPSISLAGRLNLSELAAVIDLAPLLIANNTGPVHLAAAVGTPVVDLYALTNPQHAPWGVPHRLLYHDVPCRFCYKSVCPEGHHDCLGRVEPEAVVRAACELLGQPVASAVQETGIVPAWSIAAESRRQATPLLSEPLPG